MARGLGGELAKNLGDVFAFCSEGCGACGPGGIVAEKIAVLLHGRSASCRVDDDGVDVERLEGSDHLASEMGGLIFEAGVDHESAAAGLSLRDDDFATFG